MLQFRLTYIWRPSLVVMSHAVLVVLVSYFKIIARSHKPVQARSVILLNISRSPSPTLISRRFMVVVPLGKTNLRNSSAFGEWLEWMLREGSHQKSLVKSFFSRFHGCIQVLFLKLSVRQKQPTRLLRFTSLLSTAGVSCTHDVMRKPLVSFLISAPFIRICVTSPIRDERWQVLC